MANEITRSGVSNGAEKFLAAKLIKNASLKLVAASFCEKVPQPKGHDTTAYFIRYKRMNVPVAALSEGVAPSNSTFELEQFSVTLDQWGDVLTLTDIAELTTKHPLMEQATKLLADNAQRVIDREVQIVWLANTNVQYADASVAARASLTSSLKLTDAVIQRARISMADAGAPAREGPSEELVKGNEKGGRALGAAAYVAVCGPQVMGDVIAQASSTGSWSSVAIYQNAKALYTAEVGTWLGVRFVETNFIPKFNLLGNSTAAVSSGGSAGITGMVITAVDGGGSLTSATTYYFKITRKSLLRGFEEDISIEHSMSSASTANNESFTFAFPSTAGYVYNLYFGSATGDSNLKLHSQNNAAGTTATVTAVPSSTTTAPANPPSSGATVHPVYVHAAESCKWVGLQDLKTYITGGTDSSNPLAQYRKVGYKFMAKTLVPDSTRLLRIEVCSAF